MKSGRMGSLFHRAAAMLCAVAMLFSSCGSAFAAEGESQPGQVISDPLIAPVPAPSLLPSQTPETADPTPEPAEGAEPTEAPVYEAGSLTASGEGWTAELIYPAEAAIPADAVLTLVDLKGGDLYSRMKTAVMLLKNDTASAWRKELGNEDNHFYTAEIADAQGNILQPQAEVTLVYQNLNHDADCAYFSIGAEARILETGDGSLRLPLRAGEAFGYGKVEQVQVGTVTLTHSDRDYMVTAAYGPEAGFPAGTALKVREIQPGTAEYALYSGMTDEALNEDWSEITLERYFDIAFVSDGEELEPQGDVDVQIVFRDKIALTEDHDVQAVHIENNEATVIASDTDSTKAARRDSEAIDTVSFTAESFSVYGVVQRKKIITKVLDDKGNTYEIEVTYTQEARIPENAQVKVEEIPEGSPLWEAYRKQTAAALDADDVRLPGLYDIYIADESGEKVQLEAPVSVAIRLLNAESTGELQVVHFKQDMPQEMIITEEAIAEETEGSLIEEQIADGQNEKQTEVQTVTVEERLDSEKIKATVEGDLVTFDTQSFSVYAFAYTVDFHYEGTDYSIEGNSQILLSELIPILNIRINVAEDSEGELLNVNDVESVTFTDEHLVTVQQVSGFITYNGKENINVGEKDFLLSSLKAFTSDEKLTITLTSGEEIVVGVTDEQSTLTTTIKFFALDAEIIQKNQDASNPEMHIIGNLEAPTELQSHYYVLAILKDSTGHELGWAINDLGVIHDSTVQTSFSGFHPFESQNANESADDYAARKGQTTEESLIYYDKNNDSISTLLYRADNALASVNYYQLVTLHSQNNTYSTPENGYEFGGNFTNADKTQNEIDLKKANDKTYKVRIYLDANAADDITLNDHYYLYIKVNHHSGDSSYQYVPLEFTAANKKGDYIEYEFPHWMDNNGQIKSATASNNTFTGNEDSIDVKLLKFDGDFRPNNYGSAVVNEEGSAIKTYKVHYDTAVTNKKETASGYFEEIETVDGKTVIHCIDKIELQTIDAEGTYNYASILGPNLNYGIVADHLFHDNHMQSNFAVNHYTGHGHDARPDLSGASGGQIVIAEYNKMVSDFWANGTTNGVGEIATDIPAGQLKIGSPLSGTLVIYADNDSGSMQPVDSLNYGKVGGNLSQTVVIQTDGAELSENIVEPALHYMDNISAQLAAMPATFTPAIPSSGKLTLDTKYFPDDATIFIDADPIAKFIGSAGDLIIEKRPNQTIIFNFKENRSWAADTVQFAQFVVKQDGFPENGYKTESPVGTGTTENVYMDSIARHVVWNLYGVHGKMQISSSSGGIFLQPNENSWIEINGTTAGWIVSEGVVSHPSGEWHNVFAEMPETSSVKLNAYKKVDGKQPRVSQKFNFFLDEYDSATGQWNSIYSSVMNNMGSIDFPEIKNLSTGWHVYKISESQTKPAETNGFYMMDGVSYYAVVNVQLTQTAGGQTATIVSTPAYYSNFDSTSFKPDSETLTGFSNEDKVSRVTFENQEVKEGLNILKKVQGTSATNVEFTFKVELWYEENGIISPIRTQDEINNGQATFNITKSTGSATFTIEKNEDSHSVGYITLKAGEVVNIPKEVNKAAYYRITEIAVNGKAVSTGKSVDGYTCMTEPQTGDLTSGFAQVVFENQYEATGTLEMKAHKTLKDNTNTNKTISANMFAFRLGGYRGSDAWVWNDAEGNVTLPSITYTMADMEDAVPDPDNGNKLTKTLQYTVHEKHELGTGASSLAAENVSYDDDKPVTVTLVDDGKGNIVVSSDCDDFTVQFNNTYEYQASKGFDGTKVLVGRDLEKQEFWFNAVLTKYNDTTYADDASRGTATFISATRIEGTNNSLGKILFPILTFKQTGTYTFTVTEDESRMPEDVQPTTQNQSYDVTITVSESTSSNGEKIYIASEPVYTNDKTISNTQKKIAFSVTKAWTNKEGYDINDGHTASFAIYKDGEAYSLASDQVEKVPETPGSFSLDNGIVTLTADANGWPVVNIKELNSPVAGYTVLEAKPIASEENVDVLVTYSLNSEDAVSTCPAITHNGDTLVIRNSEEDNSKNLKVTKHYILTDGTDGNSDAKKDPIYFAVKLHHNDNGWTSYYDNGHAIDVGGSKGYKITWDTEKEEWTTVDIGEISDIVNNNPVVKYEVVELNSDGNVKTTDSNLLEIKYYTNYGRSNQAEVSSISQGQGAAITIENKIPKPRHLSVTKKWTNEYGEGLSVLTDKDKVSFKLVLKDAYGNKKYAVEDGQGNISFTTDQQDQGTAFELHGSVVNGSQVWETKTFDNLQLTYYNSGDKTGYFLIETSGNGAEVEYTLEDGTVVDADHPYDPEQSGTITIQNKTGSSSGKLKIRKKWEGIDNVPDQIGVELWKKEIRYVENAGQNATIQFQNPWGTEIYDTKITKYNDNSNIQVGDRVKIVIDGNFDNPQAPFAQDSSNYYKSTAIILVTGQIITLKGQPKENASFTVTEIPLIEAQKVGETITLRKDESWEKAINLSTFDSNYSEDCVYYVKEIGSDYIVSYNPAGNVDTESGGIKNGVITITNTQDDYEKTNVAVTKIWKDDNDAFGYRPLSLTVKLLANGIDTGRTVELNAENNWTASIEGLRKANGDQEIAYTWDEGTIVGYTLVDSSINTTTDNEIATTTTTLTNTPVTTDVTVSKTFNPTFSEEMTWAATFQLQSQKRLLSVSGIEATSAQIAAEADVDAEGWSIAADVTGKTVALSQGKTSDTITGLAKYVAAINGAEYKLYELRYTVVETALTVNDEDKLDEYVATIIPDDRDHGYAVSVENVLDTNRTSLTVQKIWEGGNAPKDAAITATVKRYKLVEKTPEHGTLYISDSSSGLENGDTYQVTYSMNGSAISSGTTLEAGTYNITKTVTVDDSKYTASCTSETVSVTITADGGVAYFSQTEFTRKSSSSGKVTVNLSHVQEGNAQYNHEEKSYSFAGGSRIRIYWQNKNASYQLYINSMVQEPGNIGDYYECYYTLPASGTVDITITDSWGLSGIDDKQFYAELKANSSLVLGEIRRRGENGDTVSDVGFVTDPSTTANITLADISLGNSHPNPSYTGYDLIADENWSETVMLTKQNSWTGGLSELRIHDEDGNIYVYYLESVTESNVPEGTTVVFATEDSHKQVMKADEGSKTLTLTDTLPQITISANKVWNHNENTETQPTSVTFYLKADSETVRTETLTSANDWSVTWSDLPIYNLEGNLIKYTVDEYAVTDYAQISKTYNASDACFTITNAYVPQTGNLKIRKVVTVNGIDQSAQGQYTDRVDGAYDFEVKGPTEAPEAEQTIKYVRIYIEDGRMANYEVEKDANSFNSDWGNYEESDNDRWVVVEGLRAGTYEINETGAYSFTSADDDHLAVETTARTDMALTGITGGTVDLANRKTTLVVTGGNSTAAEVTFTNAYQLGSLKLTKALADGVPANSNTQLFTFQMELSGASLAAGQTYELEWAGSDRTTGITERATQITLPEAQEGKYIVTVQLMAGETVTVKPLPLGVSYTVSEPTESQPTGYFETEASRAETNSKSGSIGDTPSEVIITNAYDTSAEVDINATKSMKGGETPGEYTFTLTATKGTPMPAGAVDGETNTVLTAHNSGDTMTAINFGTVNFTLSDMTDAAQMEGEGNETKTEKTFTYTLTEIPGTGAGILYDPTVYTVNIRVVYDSADGTLMVKPAYSKTVNDVTTSEGINAVAFENERMTEVGVTKAWSKNGSTAAPENVTVTLSLYKGTDANAEPISSVTLDGKADTPSEGMTAFEDTSWHAKWTNLPMYENGEEITYVVRETPELAGYTVTYSGEGSQTYALNGGTITNTLNETNIRIAKVKAGTMEELVGAIFSLQKIGDNSTAIGDPVSVDLTETNASVIENLTDGDYILTETQAPAGYIRMTETVRFSITGGKVTYDKANGSLVDYAPGADTETEAPQYAGTFTVGNTAGTELPATGGSGTMAYTLAGLALMLLAGMIWISRKRKCNR